MRYIILFFMLFVGCSKNNSKPIQNISEYEYNYFRGYNAAVYQFGDNYMQIVDLSNKRISEYTIKTEEKDQTDGYANGYHEALRKINTNKNCPR